MPRRTEAQKRRKAARRSRMRRPRRDPVTGASTGSHQRNDRRPKGEASTIVRCTTGKTGFTKAEADRKLERYASESNRKRAVRRAYPCTICDHWHLTSEAERG